MPSYFERSPQLIPNDGDTVDVAIIGAGPAGLFATFYAGMRQMSVKLIDSLSQLGGQLTTLYPEKNIYDVPGFPVVTAKALAAALIEQASYAQPQICLNERVQTLANGPAGGFVLKTDQSTHSARSVIVAAGLGAFAPKRLALPEAAAYEGRGLYYAVRDPQAFAGRRVLIVGGGDTAVDWANTLVHIADHVTLVHRRDVFRAHESNVALLRRSTARIEVFHELRALLGEDAIRGVVVEDTRTRQQTTLVADAVIANLGFESSLGPLKDWDLALQGAAIKVDSTMQSSRPGIFAIGDVCAYVGKLKLIATGFGEAATAVNFAKRFIDPAASAFPGHSTSVAPQRMPKLRPPK
jgi:thioredoxin reductase (NADPH)